jgi:hypothetical protein
MNLYLNPQGRFGNNLLQYFFGYVFSQKTGANFFTRFKLNEAPFLPDQYSDFTAFDGTLEEIWNKDKYTLVFNKKEIAKDIDSICTALTTSGCKHIVATGYFQNFNYYIPYHNRIKQIFKDNEHFIKVTKNIDKEATGILIRKGDIINTCNELPDIWYIKMAEKFKNTQIYFSSDTINHPTCQKLSQLYNAKFVQGNPLNTILAFSQFKNLVLSQGTFNWWAGFLNENNVYSMTPKTGWNSEQCEIDLKIPWWNWLNLEKI